MLRHPLTRIAIWTALVCLVGIAGGRNFWAMLVVAAVGFADIRQAVRRQHRS